MRMYDTRAGQIMFVASISSFTSTMSQPIHGKSVAVQGTEYGNDKILRHDGTVQPKEGRICGLKRGAAVLLAAIILIIIIGVALGAGLGVGLHSSSAATTSATSTPASATALSFLTYSATATATSSSTSSSGPEATGLASTTCPGTNGTTYTSSNHTYTIFCENDIQAPNPSDLGRVYQPSFNQCIDSCASEASAQGRSDISVVYWVHYDAAAAGTCWCIGNTGTTSGRNVTYNPANNLALIMS